MQSSHIEQIHFLKRYKEIKRERVCVLIGISRDIILNNKHTGKALNFLLYLLLSLLNSFSVRLGIKFKEAL